MIQQVWNGVRGRGWVEVDALCEDMDAQMEWEAEGGGTDIPTGPVWQICGGWTQICHQEMFTSYEPGN